MLLIRIFTARGGLHAEGLILNWWEETEARAHRTRTPATLGQALWQRFVAARLDPDLSYGPAYDLGMLHDLCADYVKLIEGVLVAADQDAAALRRQGLAVARWAKQAQFWTQASLPAFNQLMDSLELEPDELARREELTAGGADSLPEEEAKLHGRYRNFHLLYERLDLKLASIGLDESMHRGLARAMARIYEECLVTLRLITGMAKDQNPRFRNLARLLLEINTTWHFDLGPYHLGFGELRARPTGVRGLQTYLLLAFA